MKAEVESINEINEVLRNIMAENLKGVEIDFDQDAKNMMIVGSCSIATDEDYEDVTKASFRILLNSKYHDLARQILIDKIRDNKANVKFCPDDKWVLLISGTSIPTSEFFDLLDEEEKKALSVTAAKGFNHNYSEVQVDTIS